MLPFHPLHGLGRWFTFVGVIYPNHQPKAPSKGDINLKTQIIGFETEYHRDHFFLKKMAMVRGIFSSSMVR